MSRAERAATLDRMVRSSRDTPVTLGRVPPLGTELRSVATDILHGLQYSFLAAAAHPEIRFPFGSLEEAFQGAIALRPAERRWVYHARARHVARSPIEARQAGFGRYGTLGVEEFGRVGLAAASEWLAAFRLDPRRIRLASLRGSPPAGGPGSPAAPGARRASLAFYITEVGCLSQTMSEASRGEEVHLGGLAVDADGGIARIGQFLVRDDFETGQLKDYGIPGRKLCDFGVSLDQAGAYGVVALLQVGDRAGFYQGLCEAWSKADPVFRRAVETHAARVHAPPISQVVGRVVEQFVQWLTEAFHEEGFPPGLGIASLPGGGEPTGGAGEFRFADHRGCYRVRGQWRVSSV